MLGLARFRRRKVEQAAEMLHIRLDRFPPGTKVLLETVKREYLIETSGGFDVLLQGHPTYCPEPVRVYVAGSRARGCASEAGCIRRGMSVGFWDPAKGMLTTSPVRRVRILLS